MPDSSDVTHSPSPDRPQKAIMRPSLRRTMMTENYYPEITLEEAYKGYSICVENNRDQYTGGYENSVSDGENLLK